MPGLLRGIARTAVVAGTASAVSGRVQHRQQGRWAAQEQQAEAQRAGEQRQAYPPPPAPAQDTNSKIAQLKELAGLRDAGVLTDVEFELEKRKILGG
jgi:hypothetical protein